MSTALIETQSRLQPVPRWADLPEHAHNHLHSAAYAGSWFDRQSDEMRLTVLNLYVKLSGMHLWQFIQHDPMRICEQPGNPTIGKLNFLCRSPPALKNLLRARPDFADPEDSDAKWSSREKRSTGSLHVKHWGSFTEVHIDYYGLVMSDAAWWFPPAQVGQMIAHGLSQDSYRDVYRLRGMLLAQGWDRATLLGTSPTPQGQR